MNGKALSLLKNGYTFAAVNGETVLTSEKRGVEPLLELINSGGTLKGMSAADKVVGKAAAFLYVLLAPAELYAEVISKHALTVLTNFGIPVEYGTVAEAIQNRSKTGFCPMETAVLNVSEPIRALEVIRDTKRMLENSNVHNL